MHFPELILLGSPLAVSSVYLLFELHCQFWLQIPSGASPISTSKDGTGFVCKVPQHIVSAFACTTSNLLRAHLADIHNINTNDLIKILSLLCKSLIVDPGQHPMYFLRATMLHFFFFLPFNTLCFSNVSLSSKCSPKNLSSFALSIVFPAVNPDIQFSYSLFFYWYILNLHSSQLFHLRIPAFSQLCVKYFCLFHWLLCHLQTRRAKNQPHCVERYNLLWRMVVG